MTHTILQCAGDKDVAEIVNPTWQTIEEAILKLDNRRYSALTLLFGGGDPLQFPEMIICGGKDFWIENSGWSAIYRVAVHEPLGNWKVLTHCDESVSAFQEDVELCSAGQNVKYPAEQCVERDKVMLAARTFAERGVREPTLKWTPER